MNTITVAGRGMERVETVESDVSRCTSVTAILEPQDCAGPAAEAVAEAVRNQREERTADETPRWWGINE